MRVSSLLWSFKGRITRAEFWLGLLLSFLAYVALMAGGVLLAVLAGRGDAASVADLIALVGTIAFIPTLIMVLAVHTKRFHDLGQSGWWSLLVLVPFGPIWTMIHCGGQRGERDANAYGPAPKGLSRKQQRLVFIGSSLTVLALIFAFLGITLRDSIVFFNSPTDVIEGRVAPGARIRVGGLVKEGSIVRGENLAVRFDVTDGKSTIPVAYQGLLPDLFREGQGVVAEGALDGSGALKADSVLAKHDENYMPKEVADALKRQGHWKDDRKVGSAPQGRAQ